MVLIYTKGEPELHHGERERDGLTEIDAWRHHSGQEAVLIIFSYVNLLLRKKQACVPSMTLHNHPAQS